MKASFPFCFILLYTCFFSGCISVKKTNKAKLVWADEFEYEGHPNPSFWSYDEGDGGWGNNELQFYTSENLNNARVENGTLIIEAQSNPNKPKGYTSARLVTKGKAAWKYGYIEIKAKLPEGRGTWPAIWMLPEENRYGGWPSNGEIDIMEHVGYDPGMVHGTVHTEAYNHLKGTQKGGKLNVPNFKTDFHTYAIDWTSERIDFYIDDEKYFTFENSKKGYEEWPFDQEFHLLLNIAIGGNWDGQQGVDSAIWPQHLVVDYVRVYDKKP